MVANKDILIYEGCAAGVLLRDFCSNKKKINEIFADTLYGDEIKSRMAFVRMVYTDTEYDAINLKKHKIDNYHRPIYCFGEDWVSDLMEITNWTSSGNSFVSLETADAGVEFIRLICQFIKLQRYEMGHFAKFVPGGSNVAVVLKKDCDCCEPIREALTADGVKMRFID